MDDLTALWKNVLEAAKGSINAPTFKTWFGPIKPVSFKKNTFTVSVHSIFTKEWIETRYLAILAESIQKAVDPSAKLKIIVEAPTASKAGDLPDKEIGRPNTKHTPASSMNFNYKYTFDSFVEGSGNRFAYSAALAVSEKPGKAYNPLFIYGGVGLGKTHLLHAIGQYVLNDMMPEDREYKITSQSIIKEVSKYFSIPINVLIGNKRSQYIARARHIAMYLCRDLTSDSLPAIGKYVGNRDHATVIYAVTKISELISKESDVYKHCLLYTSDAAD